jgi:uncharacterized protein YjiS (DUF1127 family)
MPLPLGFSPATPRRAPGKPPARNETPAVPRVRSGERRADVAATHDTAATHGASATRDTAATHDIAAWIRHAEAANGFGGDATSAGPLSYRLQMRARASRSAYVGGPIVAAVAKVVAAAREVLAAHRRRREARVMRMGLHELDDRTLRDIGFTRSEIESVVAEATGEAEWTRLRTRWLHTQP